VFIDATCGTSISALSTTQAAHTVTLGTLQTTGTQHAAWITAVSNALANYLPLAGGTMVGNINMGGYSVSNVADLAGSGRSIFGVGFSLADIGVMAYGASQSGRSVDPGYATIGDFAYGASQNIYNDGELDSAVIGAYAYGASQRGYIRDAGTQPPTAINHGRGAMQLFDLGSTMHALTTADGAASLLLGGGTASNRNAMVAGDGQESHGDGSITAGGGFWGSGAGVTDVNASNLGGIAAASYLTTTGSAAGLTNFSASSFPYPIVCGASNDILVANGNSQMLNVTGGVASIYMDTTASTVMVHNIALDILPFGTQSVNLVTNSLYFGTNVTLGTGAFAPSTNNVSRILFTKGYSEVYFRAMKLGGW
jgi:hypothetical protein